MNTSSSENPLAQTLQQCRPLFWAAFWFGLFINALMLAVPLYSMQVLDRVLSSGSMDTLLMLSLIAAVALLFMGLLQGLRGLVFSQIGRWLDDKLALAVVHKTLAASLVKPNLGAQPVRDLATVRGFVTSPALTSAFDAPWALIYFVVIFMIQLELGVVLTLGALVLLALALLNEKLPARLSAAAQESHIRATQALDGVIRNGEVVKAMALTRHATLPWQQHNAQYLQQSFGASNTTSVIGHTTKSLRLGIQVLLTGLGAYFVLDGQMSAGGIIAVSILSGKALAPFDAATSIYQGWGNTKKAYQRLQELHASVPNEEAATQLPEPKGQVQLEKLTYQAPQTQRWLLRGIHIDIPAGTSVGVIGASGSGKTTLARLLVGVLSPTSGQVRLDGAALHQWHPHQLGQAMGYLPQGVELFAGTIASNIARLDPEAEDHQVVAAAKLAQVHQSILQFPQGYQTDIGEGGALLSAGQRQRIALARCFYAQPKVVVLDEPNAHLDTEGEQALVRCLHNAKRQGITTITIAHRPSVLQQVDRLLVLQQGEAKLFGETQAVLAQLSADKPSAEAQHESR